jgi:hypothetical protein
MPLARRADPSDAIYYFVLDIYRGELRCGSLMFVDAAEAQTWLLSAAAVVGELLEARD